MHSLATYKHLHLSAPAKKDLKQIACYTLENWGQVQKTQYLNLIKKSFDTLMTQGNIGKPCDHVATGLYVYTVRKHSIYFRETVKEFIVIRILHSRMDVHKQLK